MKPKVIGLLLALGLFWGPAFLFMKLALDSFPPITIAASRVTIGALVLLTIALLKGIDLKSHLKHWKHFAFMGFFASALPFCFFPTAELYIPSSMAGILNASTPIFTALLAHHFASEPFTKRKIIGIFVGIAGIIVVYLPSLINGQFGNELGLILATCAALSYAVGMVYAKRHIKNIPFLVAPTYQLIFAAIFVIPFSLLVDHSLSLSMPTATSIFAICSLGIISTAVTFVLYYTIIREAGAGALSMATFLFPIVSISLGYIFLDEQLSPYAFLGTALILSSLFISSEKRTKSS